MPSQSFAYCDSMEWEHKNGEKQQTEEEDRKIACAILCHFFILSHSLVLFVLLFSCSHSFWIFLFQIKTMRSSFILFPVSFTFVMRQLLNSFYCGLFLNLVSLSFFLLLEIAHFLQSELALQFSFHVQFSQRE